MGYDGGVMTAFAWILALLPAVAQDDLEKRVADLVGRLGDPSIEAREQAVEDLVRLGPPAVPALRRAAASLDGEARGRLDAALRTLALAEALHRTLPPLRSVTLDVRNRPIREVFEDIGRQSGLPLLFEQVDDGRPPMTFAVKDATPLQALDLAARKAGLAVGLAPSDSDAPTPPRLQVTVAEDPEYPAVYVRHYRVRVTSLSLTKVQRFKEVDASGILGLQVGWAPDVRPAALLSLKLAEVVDDRGRSLRADPDEELAGLTLLHQAGYEGESEEVVVLKHPEADAAKIARLKGSFLFSYPLEVRTLRFEPGAEARERTRELHGLRFSLGPVQEKRGQVVLRLMAEGRYTGPPDPARRFQTEEDPNVPMLFQAGDLRTEMADGRTLVPEYESTILEDGRHGYLFTLRNARLADLKAIVLPCTLVHHVDRVDFELKDLPLPR
jgi:hypothetical protein